MYTSPKNLLFPILAICLLLAAALLAWTHKETLSAILSGLRPGSSFATVTVTENADGQNGSDQQEGDLERQVLWTQKNLQYKNGDLASFRRFSFQTQDSDDYQVPLSIPGIEGTVRWYDQEAKKWRTGPLEGELPDTILFIETDEQYMIISQPYMYMPIERASMEDRTRRPITANVMKNGTIELDIRFVQQDSLIGEIWTLQSKQPLVDWTPETEELWAKCVQSDIHRLSYDGFYSASPSNYNPTSEHMFFRNPAAWVVNIFVRNAQSSRAFEELGFAMCDTLIQTQNKEGFWPTEPQSDWLMEEYEIGPGFYDTRFNNDFTQTLFDAADLYQDKRFQKAACRQADFFVWLAANKHYKLTGPDGDGWLVEDYYKPDGSGASGDGSNGDRPDGEGRDEDGSNGSAAKVHCALNHQLQEMKALYRAYESTQDQKYLDTADYLLRGIKLTRDQWIKADGSLEYAYMPDGSMGLEDYPYLTYNDLFEVQEFLTRIKQARDPDLQFLMDSKKKSMDASGLTDYIK